MADSKLLKSISVSFENDTVPSSSSVEINLHPTLAMEDQRSEASENATTGTGTSELHCSSISEEEINVSAECESRNDDDCEIQFPPQSNVPTSIFRRSENNDNPSTRCQKDKTNLQSNATPDGMQRFQSSMSYDGLFEVRKSQSSKQGVLLGDREGAQSLRELRQASIAAVDEKERIDPNLDIMSKRISLLSRADAMILEARKACGIYEPRTEKLFIDEEQPKMKRDNKKMELIIAIKRTQSLDRVLSTKEVLDMATQALQQQRGRSSAKKKSIEVHETTEEKDMAPQDKKLHDALEQIQARKLGRLTFKTSSSPVHAIVDNHLASPERLQAFLPQESNRSSNKMLKRLDGIKNTSSGDSGSIQEETDLSMQQALGPAQENRGPDEIASFSLMRYLWEGEEDGHNGMTQVSPAMLACGTGTRKQLNEDMTANGTYVYENKFASMASSLMRRSHGHVPSYPETISRLKPDPRMQDWVDGQFAPKEDLPIDGSYILGKSRTVVVHEVKRGDWTWCTAWCPDGSKLAIGTENHHLAVVDTRYSVWRVTHDKRIGPAKTNTTHSIRSIAWGSHFIAIGGTGSAVSILAPSDPYPILHTITGTGFVGSLDWRNDSAVLAIGSRINKAMVVALSTCDSEGATECRTLQSDILETIVKKNWVNAVAFSPGGVFFAVGDAGGQLSIFRCVEKDGSLGNLTAVTTFTMEDSVLSLSFSPDGKWLYSGGEDFRVAIVSTTHWEIVHRVRRNRWVQCVTSSRGGTHVAVGGVSSEVSILEVGLGWDTVISIELKGLVPLSACWHPGDQYLAMAGQAQSVLVVETTNSRTLSGHFLRSMAPILNIDFSPDGTVAVIGNQQGVITFFNLHGSEFRIAYEMVATIIGNTLSICWSPDGHFVAIGSQDSLLIVGRTQREFDRSNRPNNASGFAIRKVIRALGAETLSVDKLGRYVVACGKTMEVLDVSSNYKSCRSFDTPGIKAIAWSSDGRWMATIGQTKTLSIFDTTTDSGDCNQWRVVISLEGTHAGLAVTFGPVGQGGLLYLAFGGEDRCVTVVEIRTSEGTWETVLRAQREGVVHDLAWNTDGLLAAAISNGTVSIIDLSYLHHGLAVNEMDYKAQRQAMTSFTEIRRNRGRNCMRTARWIPCHGKGSPSILAVGGTDGEVELLDMTSRDRSLGVA